MIWRAECFSSRLQICLLVALLAKNLTFFSCTVFWVLKTTSSRIQTETMQIRSTGYMYFFSTLSTIFRDIVWMRFRQMSWIFVTALAVAGRSWQPGFSPPLILRMPSLPPLWVRQFFAVFIVIFLLCSFCIRFSRKKKYVLYFLTCQVP